MPTEKEIGTFVEVALPELGDLLNVATVDRWLVREGEAVKKNQALAELTTDKVTFELPSPIDGYVAAIVVPKGYEAVASTTLAILSRTHEFDRAASEAKVKRARETAGHLAIARPMAFATEPASVGRPAKSPIEHGAGIGAVVGLILAIFFLPPGFQSYFLGAAGGLGVGAVIGALVRAGRSAGESEELR